MNFQIFGRLYELGLLNRSGTSTHDRFGPFKGLGCLGLPKPTWAPVSSYDCFQTRVSMLFGEFNRSREKMTQLAPELMRCPDWARQPILVAQIQEFLASNTELIQLLAELRKDPRFAALKGQMISTGCGAIAFDESCLEEWYIWCMNEFGPEAAREHLNQWLNAEEVEVVSALWVYGIKIENEIQIANGYCIAPAERLPDSIHKEQALQFRMIGVGEPPRFPSAAITKTCRVKKVCSATKPDLHQNSDFIETQKRLWDIAIVLNALPSVSCWPALATSYSLPIYPYGAFGGWGGSMPIHDVIGRWQTKITEDHRAGIMEVLGDFDRLADKERQRFRQILKRLSQAKRRFEIEDKVMDLGIALEMLLLKDNPNREQLALSFRLRGAWLVLGTAKERSENYRLLKEIYTYRSHVAHSGLLEDNDPKKIEEVRRRFPAYQALAEKICLRLMKNPEVEWDSLLVGGGI